MKSTHSIQPSSALHIRRPLHQLGRVEEGGVAQRGRPVGRAWAAPAPLVHPPASCLLPTAEQGTRQVGRGDSALAAAALAASKAGWEWDVRRLS